MSRPGDTDYPGFATALDVDTLPELLRGALPECRNGLELRGCTILDVRYRPNGPCWILYRLKIREERGRTHRQLVSARLLRPGERPDPPPQTLLDRYHARTDNVLSTPAAFVPEVPMAVFAFPLDAALPGLFDAVDPEAMKRHLARMWSPRKVKVRSVNVRPMGYTPQARAAFLYEVLAEDRRTGLPELRRLIAKMHSKKKTARLFADAWATWRAGGHKVGLAPPVGYIGAAGITLQEQVRGQRLGGLVSSPKFVKWVRRTGRLLANFHGLSLPLSTRRKSADEVYGVHRWAGVLMAIRPELAPRVKRLRERLASEIEARASLIGPIHADFHHTNVLVHDDHVTIIDLDEMAFGDPMVDVGRFLASLRVPARRAFGDIDALNDAGAAFLDAYMTQAGGDERRARLFEAASLLIAAGSSFRIQRRNWEEEVALLVGEAERVLDLAGSSTTVGANSRLGAARPNLSPEDQQRWATDGIYMQAALDPHVQAVYGAQVTECRVRGGKSTEGRGLSYQLRGFRADEPWAVTLRAVRRESGGRSMAQRLEQLGAALQGAADAPRLPRPVAYLRPLSLLVWEVPVGQPFSSLLGTREAAVAAQRVARALAAVHQATIELDRERTLDGELRKLRRKLPALSGQRPSFATEAKRLLEEIERRLHNASARHGPIIGTVHPHHVLYTDGRIALDKVDEIALAHPFIDTGDFLARLALLGIQRACFEDTLEAARRFRDEYHACCSTGEDGLATFEAAALLRLSCTLAERGTQQDTVERLLNHAQTRLAS